MNLLESILLLLLLLLFLALRCILPILLIPPGLPALGFTKDTLSALPPHLHNEWKSNIRGVTH